MTNEYSKHARRRYGEDLAAAIRVRLPVETDRALRNVRRLFEISVSEQIRMGIERSLVEMVPQAVEIIRRDGTSNAKKLQLLDFLRATRRSFLATHAPRRPSE